ncbi:hypothetical protein Tco_0640884, partial [Tanacetum coccineum]
MVRAKELFTCEERVSSPSLSHPPGFTPEVSEKRTENDMDIGDTVIGDSESNVAKAFSPMF